MTLRTWTAPLLAALGALISSRRRPERLALTRLKAVARAAPLVTAPAGPGRRCASPLPSARSARPRRAEMACAVFVVTALFLLPRPGYAELLRLEQAIELARERAIVVANAKAELGTAYAAEIGARVSSLGNPYSDIQIDRGLMASTEIQVLSYTYLPVDIAGQRGKRIDEAQRLIDWRQRGIVDAQAVATSEVISAYGAMLIVSARLSEAAVGEQAAREEARYFTGRLLAKDTTIYEQSLAEAEVARWVQTAAAARLELTRARARLGELISVVSIELPPAGADPSPPRFKGTSDEAYLARVLERTPILARLEAEARYWDAARARYQREIVPPVTLEVIVGRGSVGEVRLGGGAVITLPLARRYQGEIARAEQGRAHALSRRTLYRTILETRLRDARDALLIFQSASEEIDRTGIPALERAMTAAIGAFKAGKIDLARALLARRDLSLARGRRLDLLAEGWRAYADLALLLGEMP